MIQTVLDISQQNDYEIIDDINMFLNNIMKNIIKYLNNANTAIVCANIIKDLFLKVDEIKVNLVSYTILIIESVNSFNAKNTKSNDNGIQFMYDCNNDKGK